MRGVHDHDHQGGVPEPTSWVPIWCGVHVPLPGKAHGNHHGDRQIPDVDKQHPKAKTVGTIESHSLRDCDMQKHRFIQWVLLTSLGKQRLLHHRPGHGAKIGPTAVTSSLVMSFVGSTFNVNCQKSFDPNFACLFEICSATSKVDKV